MGLIKNTLSGKKAEETKQGTMLEKADIEFLLLNIKNSMISGATLEQAVLTVQKLQNIYRKLTQLEKAGK